MIALSFVGVCGTDLQILNGTRPDTAEILGHEGLGAVVETAGSGFLAVGEQVVFNPAAQLPRGWILGHNTSGLFQKYITLNSQAIADGLVMPANDSIAPQCGALVEPLAAIVYAHELISNATPDPRTAVIFGGGPVGLLAAIYLESRGMEVFLIHSSRTRLDTVVRLKILSADAALESSEDVAERIIARNGGRLTDAALICTTRAGAPTALRHAVKVVRHGGCIDLVTNYPEEAAAPPDIDTPSLRAARSGNVCGTPKEGKYLFGTLSGRRLAFTGHRGTSQAHLGRALQALREDVCSYTRLITHVLPLREAAGVIQELSESKGHLVNGSDCIKLAIDMTGAGPIPGFPQRTGRYG